MSRDDGFAIADIDTGYFTDDKVNRLWRRLQDVSKMCEALAIHQAVVLGSWASGRRRTVVETVPLWLVPDVDLVGHLMAVGLLDRSQRVPAKSWASHFGPASARRDLRRQAGAKGGKSPRKQPSSNASASLGKQPLSNAQASLNPTGRQAGPSVPSSPSDNPSQPRGRRVQSTNGLEPVGIGVSEFRSKVPPPGEATA